MNTETPGQPVTPVTLRLEAPAERGDAATWEDTEMIDTVTQSLAQVVGRLAVELLIGVLHDVAILAAITWVIIAVGRLPLIRRTPYLGRMLADAEAGARR